MEKVMIHVYITKKTVTCKSVLYFHTDLSIVIQTEYSVYIP